MLLASVWPCAVCLFQLLPENIGDPMELLSYLGPPDAASNGNGNNDDLLSLFDS